ncbi:MAG: DUF5686 family protein [Candidatus Oleimicrobiaceae bacterium]
MPVLRAEFAQPSQAIGLRFKAEGIMRRVRLLVQLLLLLAQAGSCAQGIRIRGVVRNGQTGQPLPLANIWLEGTYRGTTSNAQGEFTLEIPNLPAMVRVRYIGYYSEQIPITATSPEVVEILLQPAVVELPPVVVTGEDPAVAIMQEVIKRKQQWRSKLQTFAAEAYSRLSVANDTALVMVLESTSRLFWDGKRGAREVITSRKQTENVPKEAMIFALGFPNFYDDDVDIGGSKFIGVTNPEALAHYEFALLGRRRMDQGIVYDIAVRPKGKLQPCFAGTVSVLDSVYALVAVDLQPAGALQLPFPVQEWRMRLRQQFHSFGQDFWVPVDMQEQGGVLVGVPGLQLPTIRYDRLARLIDCRVNVPLPDSLYAARRLVSVDSAAVQQDTLLVRGVRAVPLTAPELVAYERVDSTWALGNQFRPKGPLASLLKFSMKLGTGEESERTAVQKSGGRGKNRWTVRPDLRYDRVEAFHLGAQVQVGVAKRWYLRCGGGYKTGLRRGSYAVALVAPLGRKGTATLRHAHDVRTRPWESSYPQLLNSVLNLLGTEDYFDHFWLTSTTLTVLEPFSRRGGRVEVAIGAERYASAAKQTDFALFASRRVQPANPAVSEGNLGRVRVRAILGDPGSAWSVVGRRGLQVEVERGVRGLFGGDFSFTAYRMEGTFSVATLLRRRLLPNRLELRLVAGTAQGKMPLQLLGTIDGRLAFLTPFGSLRTLKGWYQGNKYVCLFWEHNFRTLPFELLGLRWLVGQGVGLMVHGAVARSWLGHTTPPPEVARRCPDGFHQEVGISVSGLLGFLRCDVTKRLGRGDWAVGCGLARLY